MNTLIIEGTVGKDPRLSEKNNSASLQFVVFDNDREDGRGRPYHLYAEGFIVNHIAAKIRPYNEVIVIAREKSMNIPAEHGVELREIYCVLSVEEKRKPEIGGKIPTIPLQQPVQETVVKADSASVLKHGVKRLPGTFQSE